MEKQFITNFASHFTILCAMAAPRLQEEARGGPRWRGEPCGVCAHTAPWTLSWFPRHRDVGEGKRKHFQAVKSGIWWVAHGKIAFRSRHCPENDGESFSFDQWENWRSIATAEMRIPSTSNNKYGTFCSNRMTRLQLQRGDDVASWGKTWRRSNRCWRMLKRKRRRQINHMGCGKVMQGLRIAASREKLHRIPMNSMKQNTCDSKWIASTCDVTTCCTIWGFP